MLYMAIYAYSIGDIWEKHMDDNEEACHDATWRLPNDTMPYDVACVKQWHNIKTKVWFYFHSRRPIAGFVCI